MRFERIRLRNFKCYGEIDLELDAGVTVIHGLNGSGKSSLLEACFFALYGTKALETTLDEVVTIGCEEMTVELWFTHGGESYRIEREVKLSDGAARTSTCVLEGPSGVTEGATDVRERVTQLLRMDADAFVNCAYVRQGEVNKLINARPSERQDMLDDLLQLGRLEEYRERASDARVGVGRVRDDKQGALGELDDQIAAKESKKLHERHNQASSALSKVAEEIETQEKNRDAARETLERATSILDEHEQKREQLDSLEESINTVQKRIKQTAREREQLAEKLTSCQEKLEAATERRDSLLDAVGIDADDDYAAAVNERLSAVRTEIEELTEQIRETSVEKQQYDSENERLLERAEELDRESEKKREKAETLESELQDARETLDAKRDELEQMESNIEAKREQFADAPVEFGAARSAHEQQLNALTEAREQRAECEAELENARERLEEARRLREAGNCPECGQPVEESPHVDALAERRERVEQLEEQLEQLDEQLTELEAAVEEAEMLVECETEVERLERERENVNQLRDERKRGLDEKVERVETLREEAENREQEAKKARKEATEAAKQAENCREQIGECNQKKATLAERRDALEALAETLDKLTELRANRERLREQRAERKAHNDERRERLQELRERRNELRESVDEERLAAARNKREEAKEYLAKVEPKLDELEERKAEIQAQIGGIENELKELEALQERREELAATVTRLESLYEETEQLETMYAELRAQLRRKNVETLERMLNETFELVYQNDTYARLALDGEYQLSVYQKDGEQLDPEQLSGGERALFNLSLRCAIYQLLAEGIEGAAPMPPLILDEPTVFLDSGHVTQLLELIESMYDLGVDQILVVSHDEELVAAADDLVRVRKDSTTNRSTVERGREELLAGATN